MKKFTIVFIALFLIIFFSVHAQTSWTRLTPTPQENTINCMKKIPGTNKLVAACGGSTIMFSQDNGSSWEMKHYPAGKDNEYACFSVLFFNNTIGFISGSKESILKTLDGGLTWNEVYSGSTIYSWSGYFDFAFSEPSTGVAVGSLGKIIRTTDGGNTWIEVNSGVDFQLNAVDLCLSQRFIAVGADDEHYLVSNDAGQTWEIITIENSMQYGHFSDVKFISSSTGLACISGSSNKVLRTIDAGETWDVVYSGSYSPRAIDNYDEMHIAISCHREIYESGVLISDNNGLNWSEFPLDGFSNGASKTIVETSQNDEFIIAGNMGMMFRSEGGILWEDLQERIFWGPIYQAQFTNQNTGYTLAVNQQGGLSYSILQKTIDGGLTWNPTAGFENSEGAFYFLDQNVGFLVARDFGLKVQRTLNGGDSWIENETGFDFDPYAVKFYNSDNGLLTGEGYVIRTSDLGNSWEEINPGNGWWAYYKDIEFRSADEVYLVGEGEDNQTFLAKSTDGGLTWTEDSIGNRGAANDLYFMDENTAFIACRQNGILKSTDGGETWNETTLNNPNPIEFKAIYFPTSNIGYAVGDGPFETILKTTDGGDTWNPINSHTTSGLNYVHFSDDNTGLIFGDGGVVLKTTTGGITGFGEPSFSSSGSFMQIYPNPSIDEVNISINQALLNTTAQLIIYNCNGEQIESLLISDSMESLMISTSTLKPGIYFYQLKTERGIVETRKMIKR